MKQNNASKQPWLGNAAIDTIFILSPPFLCLLVIFLFPQLFRDGNAMPTFWWVILVLLIDVAHVYSTLFRTYLDKSIPPFQKRLLRVIPIVGFLIGIGLYSFSYMLFWSMLAYVAVFHFVRQQYGMMRLYSRKENIPVWMRNVDVFTIYYATIFPLLFWHLSSRNFNWFVEGDFLHFNAALVLRMATWLYYLMLLLYFLKETILLFYFKTFNLPRIAIILGTILSWYFGIVYFNGDMAFTLLNVVSHGVPYMALIWIYAQQQSCQPTSGKWLPVFFKQYGLVLFLGLIFLLAYVEEGLWDMTVWKEHKNIFSLLHLPNIKINDAWLCIIVPLLALPQITHYIIDGFIWKKNAPKPSELA